MAARTRPSGGIEFLCDWCFQPLGVRIKTAAVWPPKTYHDPECWEASANPPEGQCLAFVFGLGRLCDQTAVPGTDLCPEHSDGSACADEQHITTTGDL